MIMRQDGTAFFVAGVNYRKFDTELRGQFALAGNMITTVLTKAKQYGVGEAFILSTCNRTEIYGLADTADTLIRLLCSETTGEEAAFRTAAYVKKNSQAADHLFKVAAGLDSQILGDYEIVGQLKNALKISKQCGMVGSFLDRLTGMALQASKEIKNSTSLSTGTVSVSFAAVQAAKNRFGSLHNRNIIMVGAGTIARNTCTNLVDYGGANRITIINRTEKKAIALAAEFGMKHQSMETLEEALDKAEIIITATSSPSAFIHRSHFICGRDKLIIDLSVPVNVSRDVETCEHIRLVRIDELSKMKDDTLRLRKAEVPKAKQIIEVHLKKFISWNHRRSHAPVLNLIKTSLRQLQEEHGNKHLSTSKNNDSRIRRVLSETARKLDTHDAKGCAVISALNLFMN